MGQPSTDRTWKRVYPASAKPPLQIEGRTLPHEVCPVSVLGSSERTVVSYAKTSFEQLNIKHGIDERFLERLILFLEPLLPGLGRIRLGINGKIALSRLQEGFGPTMVKVGRNTLPPAHLRHCNLSAQALQNYPNLVLSSELSPSRPLDLRHYDSSPFSSFPSLAQAKCPEPIGTSRSFAGQSQLPTSLLKSPHLDSHFR